MNKGEEKFTVGELARKGGVSVRTLQYYDSVGLLAPSEYSEGRRRMYGKADVIRLQQILFLKSLGFALEEIRDRLLPAESAVELGQVFKKQKEALIGQISQMKEAVDLLDKTITEMNSGKEISVEGLFAIMGSIRMGSPYSFMIQHFNKNQVDFFVKQFENNDMVEQFNNMSQMLTLELLEMYKRKEDPAGEKAQELASKWWALVMHLTKGDPELIKEVFSVGADDSNWPSDSRELLEANKQFLGEALIIYFKNKGIKMPFMEGV